MKYPLNVIIWLVPIIIILGYFSFFSGSTLYFLISMVFFFVTLIIIYPFYSKGYEKVNNQEEIEQKKSDAETLEKWWEDAINGKAVSQRLIEERVYLIAIEEISDRLGLRIYETSKLIESNEIEINRELQSVLKRILDRRHSLDMRINKTEFEKDINTILDYVGGKNGN
ncbi:MAG: hypothetical protein ACP5SF_04920 [Thermoplasmata archaeon]